MAEVDLQDLPHAGQSLRDVILWGEQFLHHSNLYFGHGTDNALDESIYLVCYAAGIPLNFDDDTIAQPVDESTLDQIIDLMQRRVKEHKPAPYLVNEAWFFGMPFYVDERVLVPRSPIAELIQDQFQPWIEADKVERILDLCTGSGCIAIACAMAFPDAKVDGSDISSDALDVAAVNVERYQLQQRMRLIQSDLFSQIEDRYDIIVSNPPYVDAQDMDSMPDEFHHEPALGLAAGEQGLDMVIPMLRDAPAHLSDHGIVVIEVGNSAEALQNRFPEVPFMWLDFEHGGEGVFLLDAAQLKQFHPQFVAAAEQLGLPA